MATTLRPTGIRLNRAAEQTGWGWEREKGPDRQTQRGRDKRETSGTKDRIGQLSFHLTPADVTASDLCCFGYLSAVKRTAQDTDDGNTDASQRDSGALMLKQKSRTLRWQAAEAIRWAEHQASIIGLRNSKLDKNALNQSESIAHPLLSAKVMKLHTEVAQDEADFVNESSSSLSRYSWH